MQKMSREDKGAAFTVTTTVHTDFATPASRNRHTHQVSELSDHAHVAKDFAAYLPYNMWKDAGR